MQEDELAAFIACNPLATLISEATDSEEALMMNFAPLILNGSTGMLEGHLANMNAQLLRMQVNDQLSVIFNGTDAYISPNWYLDKTQVPTWNFEAIIIKGRVTLLTNKIEKRALLDRASKFHEGQIESDWSLDKMPDKKLDAMLEAITGFTIQIDSWQGKSKLSQNKEIIEQQNIVKGLHSVNTMNGNDLKSALLANRMEKRMTEN